MLHIPIYNQLNDLLPDGSPDPYATTDCGSECVAMVADAYGYGGVPGFTAGEIRVIIRRGNLNGVGLTTADDLVYGLFAVGKIPSHSRAANLTQFVIESQRAIAAKMPMIVLGTWDGNALHWMVCVDANRQSCTFNDPWGGISDVRDWGQIASQYAGSYVHLDRPLP